MKIIRASAQDIDKILGLCKACSLNMMNNSIDQWDDVYPNREIFLNDINSDSLYLAVSDEREEIMACIVLNEDQDPEYGDIGWKYEKERSAVIHRLMVHPNYEGKGIARELTRYVEQSAKEAEYASIRLDVFTKNLRAIKFYQSLGYEVVGKVVFRKGEFYCCEKLI